MVRHVHTFMDIKKASDMHNNVVKHTKKKKRDRRIEDICFTCRFKTGSFISTFKM